MEGIKLPDKLVQRENERRLEKEKKKEENLDIKEVDKFIKEFDDKHNEVETILNEVENNLVDAENIKDTLNKISSDIMHLQTLFSYSIGLLPGFNVRKYQKVIFELQKKAQMMEEKMIPKSKFSFKNKKSKSVLNSESKKITSNDVPDGTVSAPKINLFNECGFSDRKNEILKLNKLDTVQKIVSLSNLDNCTVFVYGLPSTIHITSVKNSTILTGPVSTSVFVDDCSNSDIIVACQQLRIHNTNAVNFYIHITSRCIIEDTTNIFVAPYNWSYDSIEKDFLEAGLDSGINNWNELDDFNWLVKDKKSPNWEILNEENRKDYKSFL